MLFFCYARNKKQKQENKVKTVKLNKIFEKGVLFGGIQAVEFPDLHSLRCVVLYHRWFDSVQTRENKT